MKKNDYQKPEMRVVKIQHQQHLLQASMEGKRDSYGDAQEDTWD